MEETRRNSMKLDIEAVRLSDNDRDQPTETYKKSSEFDSNEKSPGKFAAASIDGRKIDTCFSIEFRERKIVLVEIKLQKFDGESKS